MALEFDDAFISVPYLLNQGELTHDQAEAATALDTLLKHWSGQHNADFWERASLWTDPRWEDVRQAAAKALTSFELG